MIEKRTLINRKEMVIIVLVFVVSLLAVLYHKGGDNGRVAKIMVDGKVYREIDLSKNKDSYTIDIQSHGKAAHILVEGEKIGFINHECPDGICESAGMIERGGQAAVCLPLRVSIVIEEKGKEAKVIAG